MLRKGGRGGGIEFENFHRYGCLRAMETGDISLIRKRYAHRFLFVIYLSYPLRVNFFFLIIFFSKRIERYFVLRFYSIYISFGIDDKSINNFFATQKKKKNSKYFFPEEIDRRSISSYNFITFPFFRRKRKKKTGSITEQILTPLFASHVAFTATIPTKSSKQRFLAGFYALCETIKTVCGGCAYIEASQADARERESTLKRSHP